MTLRDTLEPFFNKLPAVASPEKHVHFKDKLWWTLGVLVLYFALANVPLFGMSQDSVDLFESYRAFFAGASGSLVLLGIGPIVTASIILQLLVGADIIKMDLSNPKDQAFFQGAQKFLVFVMILLEALPQLLGGYIQPDPGLASTLGVGLGVITLLLLVQIFIGGMLILFMDEVISKWGIGSGVGLFIVAGISQQIVTGIFNWQLEEGLPVGLIPKWIYIAQNTGADYLFSGEGLMFLLVRGGILALVSTVLIFLLVVYVESTRIEIPLAHSAVRGARGRFPVKLIYASVLPMILVRALQANVQMVGIILSGRGITFLGEFSGSKPLNGIMYYLAPIHSPYDWIPSLVQQSFATYGVAAPATWQIALHVLMDAIMLIGGGIIFALFWIETTGMGAKPTAQKIFNSGMQIPGFRRNIGSIEKVMQRYIPKVTVIGGAFIGGLTLVASLLGTLGSAGGTGLLLTVSIVYRLYEDIASEQMMEMHPMIRSFFGEQ
ncbi:preprotein translocase subunit SecY [Methanosarcina sp. 2.H.T.1A.6]|uniref:preprotein translocase subunit SecY n=1 Tax=unclassified Methanosarcina TaxID=2644672 RepID=UPI0006219075|nr:MULTISPECIES: preprotein translocase subunit SecY [unclassified Methanosarcina]KKG16499.1 preprotein translocase subunit SecY [Methanosarcina sp. 2.H.T.1A.15]KKG17504.1 preprotein translocase subunit SecY [Methanosarcina sp. 2.H.T.1A.3]KKG23333.1 preprotein translocase subunit SecY [Methanosarcina sp. 2.H.T.1A.6]KKG25909.1 preprotein translocase subunit SecY [Methanosarcina sp. 2.H.T.1A.8]